MMLMMCQRLRYALTYDGSNVKKLTEDAALRRLSTRVATTSATATDQYNTTLFTKYLYNLPYG